MNCRGDIQQWKLLLGSWHCLFFTFYYEEVQNPISLSAFSASICWDYGHHLFICSPITISKKWTILQCPPIDSPLIKLACFLLLSVPFSFYIIQSLWNDDNCPIVWFKGTDSEWVFAVLGLNPRSHACWPRALQQTKHLSWHWLMKRPRQLHCALSTDGYLFIY